MSWWAGGSRMKRKVPLAIVIVVILVVSALLVYYLEFGPGSGSSGGNPSLVYDFNGTITYDSVTGQYSGGSFLGWRASGDVLINETDAVSFHYPSTLSREFEALNSMVNVSLDWSNAMTMNVTRQLNGTYNVLSYPIGQSNEDVDVHTYETAFAVDNGTMFTVQFWVDNVAVGFLYRVKLWSSAGSS
jgi:hypothetical protein